MGHAEVRAVKPVTINPLKMSAPLGGALAFMGLDRCLPLLHGAQGCTAFGLVLMVRHFREAIPFQTTALNEVQTILGGTDNLEQAILTIHGRAKPAVIGICSTGLVETRGEDIPGDLRLIRARHPELAGTALVFAPTPDFIGGLEQGWSRAVTAMIETLAEPALRCEPDRVNLLAGCQLTPGDIEELRELAEAFGLRLTVLPDLSGSLDGHVPEQYIATTFGGTTVEDIAGLGRARWTLAVGEHMRAPAEALEKRTGVPFVLFDRLTGLEPCDRLVTALAAISDAPVPARVRRQRSQLVDAMLDGHFHFGGRKIALAGEPDLLVALTCWFREMGAEIQVAVAPTASPALAALSGVAVTVGDLDDLERAAAGADLLVSHSHGRQAAARLGVPLFHAGFPQFDRLGAAHRRSVGYRGTRDLIFEIGNILMEQDDHAPAQAC